MALDVGTIDRRSQTLKIKHTSSIVMPFLGTYSGIQTQCRIKRSHTDRQTKSDEDTQRGNKD